MAYRIQMNQFSLEIDTNIFESDIELPSNTLMTIILNSNGFAGNADMDIDIKELATFAQDLEKIYETLSGVARIEEPYGLHMFIQFKGNGRGQIAVNGRLNGGNHIGSFHQLEFENVIDQTVLKPFFSALLKDSRKYLQR